MSSSAGLAALAAHALRELTRRGRAGSATNGEPGLDLTAQELQIARLALDGLTNPEIGTRLFLSPRTVPYHLGKAFKKLGIPFRIQLALALGREDDR
jgi:DNA-binding NarL/FixJ family response regulator